MSSKYHCCATCVNYVPGKPPRCGRLGFETNKNYVFDCWKPNNKVKKLMGRDSHETE